MTSLSRALEIAIRTHDGQEDKAGAPYILHPLRVMLAVGEAEELRVVAILHDVIEDSDLGLQDLRDAGFTEAVIDGIDAMTRRDGESYEDFVRRAGRNPLARVVKRADLLDNLDDSRLSRIGQEEVERLARYRRALALLE